MTVPPGDVIWNVACPRNLTMKPASADVAARRTNSSDAMTPPLRRVQVRPMRHPWVTIDEQSFGMVIVRAAS